MGTKIIVAAAILPFVIVVAIVIFMVLRKLRKKKRSDVYDGTLLIRLNDTNGDLLQLELPASTNMAKLLDRGYITLKVSAITD